MKVNEAKSTNSNNEIPSLEHNEGFWLQVYFKLKEYEAIGTVEECRTAMERMKPRKPLNVGAEGIRYTDSYRCPTCGGAFTGTGIANHCYHCGQAIDWGRVNA